MAVLAGQFLLANNFDWMSRFSYLDSARHRQELSGQRHAGQLVKSRLERSDAGMSYTEFSYMLLQAYDFVQLFNAHGCELQAGGSDQWGNITAGIDLARRLRSVQLYGLTWPLLTKSDGSKMGKTKRRRLAVACSHAAVCLLSVLDQRRRCRCRQVPAVSDRPGPRGD